MIWVLLVSIKGEGIDRKAILTPVYQNAADVFGHILQVSFVDKPVDLAGFLVALIGRVRIVHDADKANVPERKEPMDIFSHKLQFTGKPGLCFAQDNASASASRRLKAELLRPEPV